MQNAHLRQSRFDRAENRMTSVLEEAEGNKGMSAAGEGEANDAPTDPEATGIG